MPVWVSHTRAAVYAECNEPINWKLLDNSVDTEILADRPRQYVYDPKLTTAPDGMVPFVLAAGEGERMIAGDQLYTILGNQHHSNGVFISLLTEGPIGNPIPRHRHESVTELFHCLNGEMEMFVDDGLRHSESWRFPPRPTKDGSLLSIEETRHTLPRLHHSRRLRAVLSLSLYTLRRIPLSPRPASVPLRSCDPAPLRIGPDHSRTSGWPTSLSASILIGCEAPDD